MKLVCNGLDLSDAVLKVIKAAGTKTTNPVLECIKIDAREDVVTFTATDTELTIEKKIKADVKVDGVCVVPGRNFSEFVRKLDQDEIELSLSDKKVLKIKYTDSEAEFQCMDESEYPEVYKMDGSESFYMVQNEFKELIKKIIFSVSADDSRPILKGILMEVADSSITAVALDGYRMAVARKGVERSSSNISVIVPARSLSEVSKLLTDNADDNIMIMVQKNYLMVEKNDIKLVTRLIEGDFINYRQIIPADFTTKIVVEKSKFEDGLDRASIMSRNERNNLVKFDIKERLMVLTSNSDIGNIKEKISVGMHGKDLTIAFNSKYYSDCLKVIDDEYIKVQFNSSVSPCIITPVEGDDYLFLILPVRIAS